MQTQTVKRYTPAMPPKGMERGCVYRVLDKTIAVYMGTGTRVTVTHDGVMTADKGHVYIGVYSDRRSSALPSLGTHGKVHDELTLMDGQAGANVHERVVHDYLPVEICFGRVTDLGLHVDMTTQRFTVQPFDKERTAFVLMDADQE